MSAPSGAPLQTRRAREAAVPCWEGKRHSSSRARSVDLLCTHATFPSQDSAALGEIGTMSLA